MWQGRTIAMAVALGALAAGGAPAEAALSPLYQSIREIEAILKDERLAAAFANQEAIEAIEVVDTDVYEVSTATCSVTVNIVDALPEPGKQPLIGPRQFTLRFDEPVCSSDQQ